MSSITFRNGRTASASSPGMARFYLGLVLQLQVSQAEI